MNIQEKNGVKYLTFDLLADCGLVRHAFSTRIGGVSTGCFESLNLSFTRGDKRQCAEENFRRMARAIDIPYERMCFSDQTHTANVRVMREEDAGNGVVRPLPYKDVDGMVTNVPNLPLVTFHADCVPLFFADPAKEAIGLSHSGWRGTVGKIGEATVKKMQDEFGSDPEDIIACIGPSICGKCYEVGSDVADKFKEAFGNDAQGVACGLGNGKYLLDLWEANRLILLESGILPEHIEITNFCTKCRPDLFFSHRVMGDRRGSLAAFLSIRA